MRQTFAFWATHLFVAITGVAAVSIDWPRRWIISGAPVLTYVWLLGAANGRRVLPFVSLWTLVASLNLLYAVAATSWLLYWFFFAGCYPAIFVSCLFQFDTVSDALRKLLRSLLRQLHFVEDTIAFFDLPALEIDTEVDGLMVIRGLSISLSSLTIVAHGVEVCIKLSDDIELAIRTDDVTISLLRKIRVGNVYGNLKGGINEMSFGSLIELEHNEKINKLVVEDTPLLQVAAATAPHASELETAIMADNLTGSIVPGRKSPKKALETAKPLYLVDQRASDKYQEKLRWIKETSAIERSKKAVARSVASKGVLSGDSEVTGHENDQLAATCSQLHTSPSMLHPPKTSVKVTTLQNMLPLYARKILHRLPMLYRLLLNPLSYFHPVTIESINVTASGSWLQQIFDQNVFPGSTNSSAEATDLQSGIASWLADANFAICLGSIEAWAHVPFLPDFDISNRLIFHDVMAYRVMPKETDLKRVIQLGGADASVEIPAFLLPHHEHLLPPRPSIEAQREHEARAEAASGKPKFIQAERELERAMRDETNMKISVHGRLPIFLNQELLDFALALAKASKLADMEKKPSPLDDDVHGFKDFSKAVGQSIKGGMRKTMVDSFTNDKWIAKILGKLIRKLEMAQGDVGYSGEIPISLKPYRNQAAAESKILL